jgi:hypothetical protein
MMRTRPTDQVECFVGKNRRRRRAISLTSASAADASSKTSRAALYLVLVLPSMRDRGAPRRLPFNLGPPLAARGVVQCRFSIHRSRNPPLGASIGSCVTSLTRRDPSGGYRYCPLWASHAVGRWRGDLSRASINGGGGGGVFPTFASRGATAAAASASPPAETHRPSPSRSRPRTVQCGRHFSDPPPPEPKSPPALGCHDEFASSVCSASDQIAGDAAVSPPPPIIDEKTRPCGISTGREPAPWVGRARRKLAGVDEHGSSLRAVARKPWTTTCDLFEFDAGVRAEEGNHIKSVVYVQRFTTLRKCIHSRTCTG